MGFPDSSVGKESACNAGDPGLIPGYGKIPWRRIRLPTPVFLGFPCDSAGRESTCKVGHLSSIPGLGRSPGEGKGYPLQDFGLENSMDYIVHRVAPGPRDCTETEPDLCLSLLRRYRSEVACCRGRDSG